MNAGDVIPTQNLTDDEIRRMRKAEIMQHLKMHGIEVSGGKGEMKGQLRVLRDALLTGSRPTVMMGLGAAAMGVVGGGMPGAPLQPPPPPPPSQSPQAGFHGHVGGAGLVDGYDDEYGSVVLGAGGGMRGGGEKCVECNRKGNKLCPHKRCRACCAAFTRVHGLTCPIHYKGASTTTAIAGGGGVAMGGVNGSVAMGTMGGMGVIGMGGVGGVGGVGVGMRGARGQMAYGVTVKSERPFPAGGSGSSGSGGKRSRGERGRRGHGGSGSGHPYSGRGGSGGSGSGVNIAGCAVADSGLHSNGRRLAFQRGPRPSVFYKLCKHIH